VQALIESAHHLELDSDSASLEFAARPSHQRFDLYSEKFVPYFASVTYFVRPACSFRNAVRVPFESRCCSVTELAREF
jgi:hypothetical protein